MFNINKSKEIKKKENMLKKHRCRSMNKNINIIENETSSEKNTAIFITISNINLGKLIIINKLLQCDYDVVIGFDVQYYKNKELLNKDILNFKNFISIQLKSDINLFLSTSKVPLDNNVYKEKYGIKIDNYNGKWIHNPAKLGCLEWFKNSDYAYFWYIEDDVYCKNMNVFLEPYKHDISDLICSIDEYHIPEWYYRNWKVGNPSHGFDLSHLYIARYSKQFVNNFFDFLSKTNTTSHHEIFIPYVLNYYHLTHNNLLKQHKPTLHLNNHTTSKIFNFTTNNVNLKDSIIFHPFKI